MKKRQSGFTTVELIFYAGVALFVISALVTVSGSLEANANMRKAESDLTKFTEAIVLLQNDTGQSINHYDAFTCSKSTGKNEIHLDSPQAGIESTDSGFPKWNGPYIKDVPRDPWGNKYIFDDDYDCRNLEENGCTATTRGIHRVIHSGGPNRSDMNVYDSDNIVHVLCAR